MDEIKTIYINEILLRIPESFFSILGIPEKSCSFYEPEIVEGIKGVLRSGDTAFDISSSGLSSLIMSKWVGKGGKIISFNTNMKIKESLETIRRLNELDNLQTHNMSAFNFQFFENCEINQIIPKCINLELSQEPLDFKILEKIISGFSPTIILKIDLSKTSKSNDNIDKLVALLKSEKYSFFDLHLGEIVNDINITTGLHSSYLLISKKFDEEFLTHLKQDVLPVIKEDKLRTKTNYDIFEIKGFSDAKRFSDIVEKLAGLSLYDDPELQYYLAYSLQMTGQNDEEALLRYDTALKGGFDPFWIYYNRCALYKKIGNDEGAIKDLQRAYSLDPKHSGVLDLMNRMNVKPS